MTISTHSDASRCCGLKYIYYFHLARADVTSPENRTRGMGLLGAALGLGFVFGPAIGAFLAPDYLFAAYAAAFLSFFNFIGAY